MSGTEAHADMADLAGRVARGLAKASPIGGKAFLRTPIMLPSGTTVVIVIEPEGSGSYRVSDFGQGGEQAEVLDIHSTYRTQARDVAALSGVIFDGQAFELTRVSREQLVGAVMTVGNAVGRAFDRAVQRADERKRDLAAGRLIEKLQHVFAHDLVSRDVAIAGCSNHVWTFDVVVRTGVGSAVFDVVSPHQTSVAFANMKFHDIARLTNPPARVAVVHAKEAFGDFLIVLGQAAQVIEDDAPDRSWRRAAARAA